MKTLVNLICLCLAGCFNSAPQPNPQVNDTIMSIPGGTMDYSEKNEKERLESLDEKFYDGLYDEDEVVARIYFAFDSFALSERDQNLLQDKVIAPLIAKEAWRVLLVGHSDWYGAESYNDRLGERRAQAVANFLKHLGISKARIETVSLGSRYATPDLSKPEALKDRRCDIIFKKH